MKFNTSGQQSLLSPVIMQNLGAFGIILRLKAISDGAGGFFAAWLDGRNSGFSYDGFVQHMDSSANPTFAVNGVRVSANAVSDQIDDIIPIRCAGRNYAVFYNGTANYVSVQKFDDNGNLLFGNSAAVISSTPALSVNYSQLNASAATDGIIITYGLTQTVNTTYFACKSDTNGVSAWSTTALPVSTITGSKSKCTLTEMQNNQVVLCWQDDRYGQDNVFVQNITNDGDIGVGIGTPENDITTIYPNPTSGWLYGISLKGSVKIYNVTGELVLEKAANGSLDLSALGKGVYSVKVDKGVVKKVMVY